MPQETHIHILPDEVANKIAAGEVVDRPASVLKELIENALDAGATQIDIDILDGGRTAIVVSDNGKGMNRDDAILSVERHATSKIRDVHDIEHVDTLGFRGEALAAISSVSRFTLTTRTEETPVGTELTMAGGKVLEVRDAGCPPGTSVAIRNLFFNVPARRKFLRSDHTELAHLRQIVLVYALSHPTVGLLLRVDEREVYRLSRVTALEDRLRELFGSEIQASLRPLDYASEEVGLSGFVSLPQASRSDRSEQYVFVNGRPATAPVIAFAISEAYDTLIPKGRHPVVFVFIKLDPGLVDVNVHPTKKEIRFRHSAHIRDALIQGIRKALALPAESVQGSGAPLRPVYATPRSEPVLKIPDMPSLPAFSYPRMPLQTSGGGTLPQPTSKAETASATIEKTSRDAPWSWCRILGQVGGLYVIMETEDGVILMDPHAAHERILYELFMSEVVGNQVKSQGLLTPETVELLPERAACVRKNMDLLRAMGFGISDFGGDAFIVDAMPVCLGNFSPSAILAEVADSVERGGARGGEVRWAQEQVAMAACKAAVKANDRLKVHEIEQLVTDLARAEMPYTCPHGRPTVIFMSFQELHRKFGRE